MLNYEQARCIVDMLRSACDGNWAHTRKQMALLNYKPDEILEAVKVLTDATGSPEFIQKSDF